MHPKTAIASRLSAEERQTVVARRRRCQRRKSRFRGFALWTTERVALAAGATSHPPQAETHTVAAVQETTVSSLPPRVASVFSPRAASGPDACLDVASPRRTGS